MNHGKDSPGISKSISFYNGQWASSAGASSVLNGYPKNNMIGAYNGVDWCSLNANPSGANSEKVTLNYSNPFDLRNQRIVIFETNGYAGQVCRINVQIIVSGRKRMVNVFNRGNVPPSSEESRNRRDLRGNTETGGGVLNKSTTWSGAGSQYNNVPGFSCVTSDCGVIFSPNLDFSNVPEGSTWGKRIIISFNKTGWVMIGAGFVGEVVSEMFVPAIREMTLKPEALNFLLSPPRSLLDAKNFTITFKDKQVKTYASLIRPRSTIAQNSVNINSDLKVSERALLELLVGKKCEIPSTNQLFPFYQLFTMLQLPAYQKYVCSLLLKVQDVSVLVDILEESFVEMKDCEFNNVLLHNLKKKKQEVMQNSELWARLTQIGKGTFVSSPTFMGFVGDQPINVEVRQPEDINLEFTKSLKALCNKADFSTVSIISKDNLRHHGHVEVLACMSNYFVKLLESEKYNERRKELFVDLSSEALIQLLNFFYCGKCTDNAGLGVCLELWEFSLSNKMKNLSDTCERLCGGFVTQNTKVALLQKIRENGHLLRDEGARTKLCQVAKASHDISEEDFYRKLEDAEMKWRVTKLEMENKELRLQLKTLREEFEEFRQRE